MKRTAIARLALAVVLAGTLLGPAFGFVPKRADTPLDQKAFFKPELHISTANVAYDELAPALRNRAAWNRYFQDNGADVRVWFDRRSGTPTNVLGHVAMLPGRGAGNHVTLADIGRVLGHEVKEINSAVVAELMKKFVVKNADAFGIDTRQIGEIRADKVSNELWQISMKQKVGSVPVRWGRLAATINNGNMVVFGTETWGNVTINGTPAISGDEAMKIGFDYAGGTTLDDVLFQKLELEFIPVAPQNLEGAAGYDGPIGAGYAHRLAWSFGFRREGVVGSWQVSVDAHTGEVLEFKDINDYATERVSGGIYPVTATGQCPDAQRCGTMQLGEPMPWANTGLATPNDYTNSAGLYGYTSGTMTTTLNGKYVRTTDTCGAVSESTTTGPLNLGGANNDHDCTTGGTSAGNTPASRSAFYELNKLKEMARGWLPNNTWLQGQLTANLNLNSTCNAYWDGSTVNFYKSGGGCRNTGEIAAVFDHEWGHGLDKFDTGGAMSVTSETYADVAAIYRLQASCVGYGFWWTSDQGCGQTSDGTGFNGDNGQTSPACELDCSGVRGADWMKHAGTTPDTPANFACTKCNSGGSGPCGREVHCDAMVATEAAWDFAARDLQAAPFNYDSSTAFMIANKVFYQGSGNIGSWHSCSCPSTSDGCGSTNAYMQWLAADDDDGNINNGTPHMTALYAAFSRHSIACATPAATNGGCSGGPTTAPTVTVAPSNNQNVLSWTAVPGAVNYWVLRSEGFAGCDFGKALIATVAGTTYTDPDVANGTPYWYNVVAVGSSTSCFGPASACKQATPQPCAGSVSLNKTVYNCADAVGISMTDSDLIGAGTTTVTAKSTTEAAAETVILTENPASSGIFVGSIPTTSGAPVNGDGALSVSNGDVITVEYVDASYCGEPNHPVDQTAPVDCAAPIISAISADGITGSQAFIHWTTNEPANSTVNYGRSLPLTLTASSAALATTHTQPLTGLSECSLYYYGVQSADPAGNVGADTNGGAYYTFRTGKNVNPNYTSTDTPVAIPDSNTTGASSVIAVSDTNLVLDVNVTVNITHTYDGDLSLYLIGPTGTQVTLSARRGSSGDNFTNTVFDDSAATSITSGTAPFTGSYKPEGLLSVFNNAAPTGNWTLKVVDGAGSDTGNIVDWTLSLTYPTEDCGATLRLDADTYSCSALAGISVKDTTLTGQPSLTVTIASNGETIPETVTLLAQPAPHEDTFVGTVQLTAAPASHGDGLLTVTGNDTITVSYLDADDGQGNTNVLHTDTATTDCAAPAISAVASSNITGTTATISWATNEASTSVVHFGTAIPPAGSQSSATMVTAHSLVLTGLTPCSTYFYSVESTDAFGNTAIDTNNGNYYLFVTPQNTAASYTSTDGPVAIPDNNATGGTSTIHVADPDVITDLNVVVNINHTFDGDIALTLIAPNGTTVPLSTKRGSSGDNYTNTVFDDAATTAISAGTAPFTGSFKPESPLSVVNGLSAAGDWKLKVVDNASTDSGTIQNWTVQFTYQPRACGPHATYQGNTRTDICPAGGTGSGNGVIERGEDVTMPVTIRNDGTVTLTGVTAILTATTPDVYVTRNTATFADVATAGTVTSNAPHFAYTVGPSVPCGSDISFALTIVTNQGSFTGSTFTVKVGTPAQQQTTFPSTDVPKPIPDNNTTGVSSTVSVAATGAVQDVNVTVNITHTWDGDLTLYLVGPNGTQVTLSAKRGSSGDNYTNTVFDDAAATSITSGSPPYTGTFRPEGSLAVFNGIPANGTWSLKVTDTASSDSGTITGWSLQLTYGSGWSCTDCVLASPVAEPVQQVWVGRTGQTWEPIATASFYNLYRGTAGDLPALLTAANDSCLRLTTATNSTGAVLSETPAAGSAFWYIVRAGNGGGEGTAGNATAGPRIQNSTGNCP